MAEIKAIETVYKGYRFRSRLEARWAVFFDSLSLDWKYECEGFESEWTDDNGKKLRYLPDFYLPRTQTWVEVKGSTEMLLKKKDFFNTFLDFNSALPGMMNSHDMSGHIFDGIAGVDHTPGLLILGDIPYVERWGPVFHRLIQHHEGLCFEWALFFPEVGPVRATDSEKFWFIDPKIEDWTADAVTSVSEFTIPGVIDAYREARQARFEHGETPKFR